MRARVDARRSPPSDRVRQSLTNVHMGNEPGHIGAPPRRLGPTRSPEDRPEEAAFVAEDAARVLRVLESSLALCIGRRSAAIFLVRRLAGRASSCRPTSLERISQNMCFLTRMDSWRPLHGPPRQEQWHLLRIGAKGPRGCALPCWLPPPSRRIGSSTLWCTGPSCPWSAPTRPKWASAYGAACPPRCALKWPSLP